MNHLVILENHLEFSRKIFNYLISRNKKICLSSIAINRKETVETLNSLTSEDIVLLDLESFENNGLKILDRLTTKKERMPHIIVISKNIELLTQIKENNPYVYQTIKSPFPFKKIAEIIEKVTYQARREFYERLVKEELYKFDMNITTKGYAYIVDAVVFSLEDETQLKDMKNDLYKNIAIKYKDANITNVKWTIEKCIRSTKRYTSNSIINPYFHVGLSEELTPKIFIVTIVENVKMKIKKATSVNNFPSSYSKNV